MREIVDREYILRHCNANSYSIDASIKDQNEIIVKSDDRRFISWSCNLPLIINQANVLESSHKTLPPILDSQEELYFLTIPSQLGKTLKSAKFIKDLRGLVIMDGNFRIDKKTVFAKLIYLTVWETLQFQKDNLPCLRTLFCKYTKEVMKEVQKYNSFDKLSLKTVNYNVFDEIAQVKNLYGLQIHSGKLDNLSGISSISSIYWLSLHNLQKISDLAELTHLPHLSHLSLGYCKNVADWDFLLELKNLKSLDIYNTSYKDYPPQFIVDTLIERGVVGVTSTV